jgi:hypothetical protein
MCDIQRQILLTVILSVINKQVLLNLCWLHTPEQSFVCRGHTPRDVVEGW